MPDGEHDPTLVEFVYRVQYASDFWRRSYYTHAEGGVSIHQPAFLDGEVLLPVYVLERGKAFRRRPDM
jgi:hypothetical protein